MPAIETATALLMIWAAVGYLAGSIPSGVLLARALGLGDLRQIGSGNIGATNVLRTGNKSAAALTLLFDALKGLIPVLLARAVTGEDAAQLAGLAAFIGHCFPVWLKFKGGKGVATFFGVTFGVYWPLGIVAALIWLAVAAVSRYSSLAALMTAGFAPLALVLLGHGTPFFLMIALGLLVYARHWQNIQRLRRGEETKIGAKG